MTLLTLTALLLGQALPQTNWPTTLRTGTLNFSQVQLMSSTQPAGLIFSDPQKGPYYRFSYQHPSGDLTITSMEYGWSIRIRAKDGHVFWSGKTPDKSSREFWDAITMLRKQLLPKDLK